MAVSYKSVKDLPLNQRIFYTTIRKAGYSHAVASAFIGNLMYESGGTDDINIRNVGDNGTSFGAAQWRGSRLDGLKKLAANRGLTDIYNAQLQADFLVHELNSTLSSVGDSLRGLDDYGKAHEIVLNKYEIPAAQHRAVNSYSYRRRHSLGFDVFKNYSGGQTPTEVKSKYKIDRSWRWGIGRNDVKGVNSLHSNLYAYLDRLPSHLQKKIVLNYAKNGKHSDNSRHYTGNAVDLSYDEELYNYIKNDNQTRSLHGLTLLRADHGSGKHIHLSYGQGRENYSSLSVTKDPFSNESVMKYGSPLDLTGKSEYDLENLTTYSDNGVVDSSANQNFYVDGFRMTDASMASLLHRQNELLEKQQAKDEITAKMNAMRSELIERQKERDFLVAQTMATKLKYIER